MKIRISKHAQNRMKERFGFEQIKFGQIKYLIKKHREEREDLGDGAYSLVIGRVKFILVEVIEHNRYVVVTARHPSA